MTLQIRSEGTGRFAGVLKIDERLWLGLERLAESEGVSTGAKLGALLLKAGQERLARLAPLADGLTARR